MVVDHIIVRTAIVLSQKYLQQKRARTALDWQNTARIAQNSEATRISEPLSIVATISNSCLRITVHVNCCAGNTITRPATPSWLKVKLHILQSNQSVVCNLIVNKQQRLSPLQTVWVLVYASIPANFSRTCKLQTWLF